MRSKPHTNRLFRIFSWFALTYLVGLNSAFCQDLLIQRFTIDDGLPSNTVYSILSDKNGFLWVGTERGVARYDGVEFKIFNTTHGLSDNNVVNIVEDNKGRIWFIHHAKLHTYYYRGKIYNHKNCEFLKSLHKQTVKPPNYTIDYTTKQLYFQLKKDDSSFKFVNIDGQKRLHKLANVQIYQPFGYYVETGKKEKWFFSRDHSGKLQDNKLNTQFKKGALISTTNKSKQRVYFTDPLSKKIGWLNLGNGKLESFAITANLFIENKARNELLIFREGELEVWNYTLTLKKQTYTIPKGIINVFAGKQGQIWMMSHYGLYLIAPQFTKSLINSYSNEIAVHSFYIDQQRMFFGTNGFGVLYRDNGTIRNAETDATLSRVMGFAKLKNSIIVGCDNGLFKLTNDKLTRLLTLATKDVEQGEKEVLVATAAGIIRLTENDIQHFQVDRTTAIFRVSKNEIWYGTVNGIFRLKNCSEKQTSKIITHTICDQSVIKDIKRDKHGRVWIATEQSGLFVYNRNSGFQKVSSKNATIDLASEICQKITIDEQGHVWIATSAGVSRVKWIHNKSKPYIVDNFASSVGIIRKDIYDLKIVDNKLILATGQGCFETEIPKQEKFSSPTFIDEIRMNDKVVSLETTNFKHFENNFSFVFSASFIDAVRDRYQFRYRLKEHGNKWTVLHTDELSLLNLQPGSYTLEVRAFSGNGDAGEISTWKFKIAKAWYNSFWFFAFIAFVVISLIIYFGRREVNRIRTSRNVTQMELKVLRAQMNPHFIFNALNSIQQQLFTKDFKSTNNYLTKFGKLLRSNIHYSAMDFISVDEEIQFLTNYFELEKYRFEELFDFQIRTDHFSDLENYKIPAFLVQPILENSIKHGFKQQETGGLIQLSFTKLSDELVSIIILDNGCGLPVNFHISEAKNIGDSVGLGIIVQRLKLLSKQYKSKEFKFELANRVDGLGTVCRFVLPLQSL